MKEFMLARKRRIGVTFTMFFVSLFFLWFQNSLSVDQGDGGIQVVYVVTIFLMAACCEFVDTTLGMGYGTSLTPILMMAGFSPIDIIPSILASELLTGGFASIMHYRDGNFAIKDNMQIKRMVITLSVLSFFGAMAAVMFSFKLTTVMWKYFIVAIICSMGLIILFSRNKSNEFRPVRLLIIGFIASFNKGLSGGGYGPLMTAGQVTSGVSSRMAVAVTSFTEFFTSLVAFSAFIIAGAKLNYHLMIPLILGAVSVVPFATLTVKRVNEKKLKSMIGFLTLTLGTLILVKMFIN